MAATELKFCNINVGLLGHVDSGKTSLARALSDVLSTASLDKSRQAKDRGISLDLGFSSFRIPLPEHLKEVENLGIKELQFTIVDCPGHASLMKTIVGGAQIIDLMLLVVDITKGIQTQTAECLILGELLTDSLIVVLNKTDLLPEGRKEEKIEKMKKKIGKVLSKTRFKGSPMVCVYSNRGGADYSERDQKFESDTSELIEVLIPRLKIPDRALEQHKKFICAVDHCFPIKGKGTIMTGTILQGNVAKGDTIFIPALGIDRKVKGIQIFHKDMPFARSGDRLAMALSQVDNKQFERGFIGHREALVNVSKAIVNISRIRYYKKEIKSGAKYHLTVGHTTVLATATFFRHPKSKEIVEHGFIDKKAAKAVVSSHKSFTFEEEYLLLGHLEEKCKLPQYALLEFERPIIMPPDALFIASKMDADINLEMCRLAFHGKIIQKLEEKFDYSQLKLYRPKVRKGQVNRVTNEFQIIGAKMFSKLSDITVFNNMKVQLSNGVIGTIDGSFGKSGMFKVRLNTPLDLGGKKPKEFKLDAQIFLKFKKYVYHVDKRAMIQTNVP